MPRGDRTGPEGLGPRTGRAAGYCSGFANPGYVNRFPDGRGMGFGRRRGSFGAEHRPRGRGLGYPSAAPSYYPEEMTKEEELASLKNQVKYMNEDIKATEERIAELEKGE